MPSTVRGPRRLRWDGGWLGVLFWKVTPLCDVGFSPLGWHLLLDRSERGTGWMLQVGPLILIRWAWKEG